MRVTLRSYTNGRLLKAETGRIRDQQKKKDYFPLGRGGSLIQQIASASFGEDRKDPCDRLPHWY